jgi:hypothetical protein
MGRSRIRRYTGTVLLDVGPRCALRTALLCAFALLLVGCASTPSRSPIGPTHSNPLPAMRQLFDREFGDRSQRRRRESLATVATFGRREALRIRAVQPMLAGLTEEPQRVDAARDTVERLAAAELRRPNAIAALPWPTTRRIGQRIADGLMAAVMTLQQGSVLPEISDARHYTGGGSPPKPVPWWRRLLRRLWLMR